jgi:hypothetical protein
MSGTYYDESFGMLANAAFENQQVNQELQVGAQPAQGTVTVVDYSKLTEETATPSATLAFGAPDPGDTIVLTGLPSETGPVVFTCVAADPAADEFTDADELAALIDGLDDLGASNAAGTITITVATAGTKMNAATVTGTGTFNALSIAFSGGQDHAVLTVIDADGTVHALVEGTDWTAETSNDVTADNLATAIDGLDDVTAADPAAAAITVVAAEVGYSGTLIGLQTSDAVNLTISGATLALAESGYIFDFVLSPAPIMHADGTHQAKPSFNDSGATFVNEVGRRDLVVAQGDWWIDFRTGQGRVFTPDGQSGTVVATWIIKLQCIKIYT